MIDYIGLNDNGDYVFHHTTKGKLTVGKWSVDNPSGGTNSEHAWIIAEQSYNNMDTDND